MTLKSAGNAAGKLAGAEEGLGEIALVGADPLGV
jgi:hypothetical protein